uniref:Uncharacterized protein n=1 Tax=Megaselia scalaris TaxID=36166 RepID=T1GQ80_MEGSC
MRKLVPNRIRVPLENSKTLWRNRHCSIATLQREEMENMKSLISGSLFFNSLQFDCSKILEGNRHYVRLQPRRRKMRGGNSNRKCKRRRIKCGEGEDATPKQQLATKVLL